MAERADLPLFAWGDARRARRLTRRQLLAHAAPLGFGCLCLAATILARPLPRLVWNASASAPVGLYRVNPGAPVGRGDLVIARTPSSVRDLAAARLYVPANVPLVKRVAAVAGDQICAVGARIAIDRRPRATRRLRDRLGRPLPWWTGCRTLRTGMAFLLMDGVPDSFDGRYFGPTPVRDIIGKATPLWVR
ncbi:MAG: S26 family signal peptidase [Novosphingobium sp.]|nr:S26 family signal peptidase [Novosphingobium sp.]